MLVRREQKEKPDDRYEGPIEIVEVDRSGNRAKIDYGHKEVWDNVRRLIPWRGTRCGANTTYIFF